MSWGECDEEERRKIAATRLSESTERATARQALIGFLISAVGKLATRVRGPAKTEAQQETRRAMGNASKLASEAAAGKLEALSLEGDVKLAEIQERFAQARLLNAQAAQIEEDVAWKRLERALKLADALGAKVEVKTLPDGTPAIVVGDGALISLAAEPADSVMKSLPRPAD